MKLRNISKMLADLFVICILIKFLALLHPFCTPSMPSLHPWHFGVGFIPLISPCCTLTCPSMPIPCPYVPLRQPVHAPYVPFGTLVHPFHITLVLFMTLLCTLCANSMPICIHSGPFTCPPVIPYVLGPNPSFSMTPARNGSTRTSAEEQSLFTILIPSG